VTGRKAVRLAAGVSILALAMAGAWSCKRRLDVPEPIYRETVSAFYTGLAALQTSQDVLAREKLERVIALVPEEPAGWADLGLLLMRQQEIDQAAQKLTRAAELAPRNGAIQRLLALAESRRGKLPEAIAHLKRALESDPGDLKAAFVLAQETERQGGAENEAEAQRVLEALLARSENLAARLDYARLAAKRGDGASLQKAIGPLAAAAPSWPEPAQEQWKALQEASVGGNPRAAGPRVAFLKNVLVRVPEYRRSLAAVSTPRDEVGEPLVRFLALPSPEPRPAAPDESLRFAIEPIAGLDAPGTAWVGPVWLNGEGPPAVAAADRQDVRFAGIAAGPRAPVIAIIKGAAAKTAPGPDGIVAADLDYDFRTDVVIAGAGGLSLWKQEEGGRFRDLTAASKLPATLTGAPAFGVWAVDADTDGDIDLVVAPVDGPPVVLRNNGDGTFAERRPFAGVARVRGFAWGDFDGEGVPDAAFLDAEGTVRVFLSVRGGDFRERPLPAGFPKAAALAVADLNGDGILDVLALTATGTVVRLSQGEDGKSWQWAEVAKLDGPPAGLAPGRARLIVADLDNNGGADLVIAGPTASRVLLSDARGAFKAQGGMLALSVRAAVDTDGDGRLELLGVDQGGRAVRAVSQGGKAYHWQALRPRAATATGDQRINSFGIGGEIEVRTGLHAQKQPIAAPVVHFGLGEATRAEVVRITWPNGILQSEFDKGVDAAVLAEQRLKGSCPWLFAWNGREMAFVTDLIWRSPLGLRINAQTSAEVLMTEDRVKLRGEQLVPRDGVYDLRVTAELWETHFFDLVGLLLVDHPEGTEVFVDERFAVPPPKLEAIATGPVREMRAVRDDQGHDVSEVVRARDGRHLDFAGRGAYQGVTREHFVEMELPDDAPRRGPLYLVAQGWVHPTDSSINVALGQGSHAPPQGLALHVADPGGRFHEVRRGLGFPAGKDKTVLLDLEGLFPPDGPRRLRLRTNLEIFWDRLGWAAGRPDVTLKPRVLELRSAELRYRGYSVTEQKDASSPERPRYLLAGTAARWRDLEGYHTRFGDVKELLAKVDDRYVIMNAGDEMLLRFAAAAPPAAGQQRDFVVVGDGWVKDGDYNTTFSRTVLPLPTHATGRYDTPPARLEDDPVYKKHPEDFALYHTRYVSPSRARDALRDSIDPGTR
jgi:Tfp pilus assembly protein PilF